MILLKIKILRIIFQNDFFIRTTTKPNLSGERIVIDDRIEEKAESSQATKKFDWGNGEQNLWQEFVLLRGIAGLSRTRGVAQFSETWKSRSNFMKCGASLTVPAPCQWYSIQSNLLISLSFHDYSQKRSSSLETIYFQDIVEICRRIYNVFK